MQSRQASNAWRVLALLFIANMLNFYDRIIPGLINEPVRIEFHLKDFQLGLISTAFTLVYGVFALPLGRLADTRSRKAIMGVGLVAWSVCTGLTGLARNFAMYLLTRMAVGVGEASFGPASMSMIGDLFPSDKRGRALGLYWLGLPVGIILASVTVGAVVRFSGSWRTAYFVATIPGLLLAGCMFFIKEPLRGGAEATHVPTVPLDRPIRRLLRIRTLWWLTLAGTTVNFSSLTANAFLVPLLQRYFDLSLGQAAAGGGIILGVAGLIGFTAGGWLADQVYKRSEKGRLVFGAASMALAAGVTWYGLSLGKCPPMIFVLVFTLGWIPQYQCFTCGFAAIQDVAEPRLRAMATALFYVVLYLVGATLGPTVVGWLSDRYAHVAMVAAGSQTMTTEFMGLGLHQAMYLIPVMLLLTAVGLLLASLTFRADATAMKRSMSEA